MMRTVLGALGCVLGVTQIMADDSVEIGMNQVSRYGVGESIGTIVARNTSYGVLLNPKLRGLTPGLHGFHLHENPDCGAGEKNGEKIAGLAAGGHHDPDNTDLHDGPFGSGHLGDLPALFVGADGTATHPVLAPRLNLNQLDGRSLIVHAGGDNYSDQPKPLGGGGPRMACGVIK